ncbi:MAG: alpha-hydroxy-acid oxidizing protein [Oscillospiraceae bacterium]|nr:alpha-hydroxy-acid oxidizing protein [Oscillospiraceae bacterium]
MTYQEVLENARQRTTKCKVCPVCNGVACKGQVPGPGAKGDGKSFTECLNYLRNIDILMDPIFDNTKGQDSSIELFGETLSMPVLGAPCGGAGMNFGSDLTEYQFTEAQVNGALQAGTMAFTPDAPQDEMYLNGIEMTKLAGGMAVPTIKPWKNERIIHHIRLAEEAGAKAVCCDVDSAGLINLKLLGKPVDPKSAKDLEEIISCTRLPFIVKGLVTPRAAKIAAELGAYGIVISTHGGRIIPDAPATASVIGEIRAAVGNKVKIFVDGGIRSGGDVYKCLALGADAVLIGRPVCHAAIGGGAEGVALYLEKIKAELHDNMLITGCNTLADITKDKIRNRNNY